MKDAEANLVEIFSSVQGEGIHIGASTLFVRFGECDLRCRWCDTPHSWKPAARCRIETVRGTGEFRSVANPVSLAVAAEAAAGLDVASHRFVSLTGGEPLLQPDAVAAFARHFRVSGPRIHLETHGLHAEALESVIDCVDVVSMDWKLASDVRRASEAKDAPAGDFHAAHREFLRVALKAPEVMVKVVVTSSSLDAEFDEMAAGVAAVGPEIPVIVQPVTPFGAVRDAPRASRILEVAAVLERTLADVRVIPQAHKLFGAL